MFHHIMQRLSSLKLLIYSSYIKNALYLHKQLTVYRIQGMHFISKYVPW